MAKILIVEDDLTLSQVLRDAIEGSGHDVLEASDGVSASKIVKDTPFDLVVSDIFLPEMDGLELISEMKIMAPEAKIIAISGGGRHDKETYLKAAMTFGADRRIDKPFPLNELLDTIEELLGIYKVTADKEA